MNNAPPKPMPKAPMMSPQAAMKAAPPINHPAVAEYVGEWNRMAHEIDRLSKENHQLKSDLEIARSHISELQHISDHERHQKEMFQRWASRCDALAGEVARMAIQLRDESNLAAQPQETQQIEGPPPPAPAPPPDVENDIAAIARKFAPSPAQGNSGGV
jgi:DNA repair exonuclease SbcCD ATPase subunit